MGRLIHTGLGLSSLIAHVLHSPPPHEQLYNRSCSNKTHTPPNLLVGPLRERERERERDRERALLGTTVHNGGSRVVTAARTPHHHTLSYFPDFNGGSILMIVLLLFFQKQNLIYIVLSRNNLLFFQKQFKHALSCFPAGGVASSVTWRRLSPDSDERLADLCS
jgi:hypothetical protein